MNRHIEQQLREDTDEEFNNLLDDVTSEARALKSVSTGRGYGESAEIKAKNFIIVFGAQ